MITVEERDDIIPLCPHCKSEIRTVFVRHLSGFFGRRYLYFCSNCRAALGVSHRKGFWMG